MRSQQVRRLGPRKAEDGLGQPWSPPWAWLSSLSPEGLACWGARSLRAPQRLQAGGACGSPSPSPRPIPVQGQSLCCCPLFGSLGNSVPLGLGE